MCESMCNIASHAVVMRGNFMQIELCARIRMRHDESYAILIDRVTGKMMPSRTRKHIMLARRNFANREPRIDSHSLWFVYGSNQKKRSNFYI